MEAKGANDEVLDWEPVRPILDWAICELGEEDRSVVSLRFLEGMSYGDIAERIGASEDASRMRVNRALERLRRLLVSKGVRSTGVALCGALSAQVALSAPVQLSASICPYVASGLAAGTGSSAIGVVVGFMNTTKATVALAITVTAVTVGVVVWQSQRLAYARLDLALLEGRMREATRSESDLSDLRARLNELDAEIASFRQGGRNALPLLAFEVEDFEEELTGWAQRMESVERFLEANDSYRIPELELLTMEEWISEIKESVLESEADYRKVLSRLRYKAKLNSFERIASAVRSYQKATEGRFPKDPQELLGYFDEAFDPQILSRFRYSAEGDPEFANFTKGSEAIVESTFVDPIWDTQFCVTAKSSKNRPLPAMFEMDRLVEASKGFAKANGREPFDANELLPFMAEGKDHELISQIFAAMRRKPVLAGDAGDSGDDVANQ